MREPVSPGLYKNLYVQPETPPGRAFFGHTAFIFLAIRHVCLQKIALSAGKIPRSSGIPGYTYRF